jgi:hypothetical protein
LFCGGRLASLTDAGFRAVVRRPEKLVNQVTLGVESDRGRVTP